MPAEAMALPAPLIDLVESAPAEAIEMLRQQISDRAPDEVRRIKDAIEAEDGEEFAKLFRELGPRFGAPVLEDTHLSDGLGSLTAEAAGIFKSYFRGEIDEIEMQGYLVDSLFTSAWTMYGRTALTALVPTAHVGLATYMTYTLGSETLNALTALRLEVAAEEALTKRLEDEAILVIGRLQEAQAELVRASNALDERVQADLTTAFSLVGDGSGDPAAFVAGLEVLARLCRTTLVYTDSAEFDRAMEDPTVTFQL